MNDLLFSCSEEGRGGEERGGEWEHAEEKNAPGTEVFPHWLCPPSF